MALILILILIVGSGVSHYNNIPKREEQHKEGWCNLFNDPSQEPPVCKNRRFEMIKYSFGHEEEYVAIKEYEYDELTRTNDDACHAYREIFRNIDEGWFPMAYPGFGIWRIDFLYSLFTFINRRIPEIGSHGFPISCSGPRWKEIDNVGTHFGAKTKKSEETILTNYTPYPSRRYDVSVPALHKKPQRIEELYAVSRRLLYAVKFRRTSLTGFPVQSVRSSNVIALDSPYLLVLITRTPQSRQHESRKSPTAELFDVDSRRISIHHCEY
ncbi:hypothetical protein Tco_0704583 [Tanacetum coccineum]|uniref:Uncharacterized protein n=1 Tax=Tanacetum coccineum TaxID=301880 RepID=A0ABQ4Y405_9ASTR